MTGFAASVPVAACQPGDTPENGVGQLDGQVPVVDRIDGRAASGYNCNLRLVGNYSDFPTPIDLTHNATAAWATLDTYGHCAYYGQAGGSGWTSVMDVSDPAHPKETAKLATPAMTNPWESMRVNQKRGLLVADHNANSSLDIYDVSQDCAHPKLLRSLAMPAGPDGVAPVGHEGWFEPDGLVYYMSCLCDTVGAGGVPFVPSNSSGPPGGVWAIDLTNPSQPKTMYHFTDVHSIHGGSESADGTRAYMCQTGSPDALLIVDTSDIQNRRPNPKTHIISSFPYPDNSACQSTYPLVYGSHPYVVQYGESSPGLGAVSPRHCTESGAITTFSAPRIIDIENEAKPKLASNILLGVDDPANCPLVQADLSARSVSFFPNVGGGGALFEYDVHHCSPDRLQDPTLLACATFLSGLRIYDIRHPSEPRELAYYSMGTISLTDQTVDDTISRPVIWGDRGLVLFTSEFSGFHVAKFEGGVWPFGGQVRCPSAPDYYFGQYNPNTSCTYGASTTAAEAPASIPNTSGSRPVFVALLVIALMGSLPALAAAAITRRKLPFS